ncbi:MAG: aminotransferase class III-fold pyridoxal phosphate-dependent enzyme [bacterium]|nr:aminotransferase class III-fold pyridoxal phosphate-dependent enzyme [bacterium]
MNEKDMLEMISPWISDEEIFRLNAEHYVETTQCFDRIFTDGIGSDVYESGDTHGSPRVYRDFISRVGSAPFGTDRILRQIASEYVAAHGYRNVVPHHEAPDKQTALLARDLLSHMPPGYRLYLGQSGAEAVEAGIKFTDAARYRNNQGQRTKFIAMHGAFHGRTLGALSFSSNIVHRRGYRVAINDVISIPYPAAHPYFVWTLDRSKSPHEKSSYAIRYFDFSTYTPEQYRKEHLDPLLDQIETISTLIVEDGVQGEGGMNVGRTDLLQELYGFCRQHGIFVMLDAVQSGIGRTGKMFAFEYANFSPDIVTLAKALSDGLPQSATICKKELAPERSGRHSNTNGGNPFISLVSRAVLSEIKRRNLLERVSFNGDVLRRVLKEDFADRYDVVHSARNLGYMGGIEFWNPDTRQPDPTLRDAVAKHGLENGLLLLGCGISGIRIMPPLTTSVEALVTGLNALAYCVQKARDEVARKRATLPV